MPKEKFVDEKSTWSLTWQGLDKGTRFVMIGVMLVSKK